MLTVMPVGTNQKTKKSQLSFGVSYTKATPSNLKKAAGRMIEDSGSLDLAKSHIDKLVELGKSDDGLLAHFYKSLSVDIKPADSKSKRFFSPAMMTYTDKGPNDWFAYEVDTLAFASTHPKFFKKVFNNSKAINSQGVKYTMTDFLDSSVVRILTELPKLVTNKAKDTLALTIAKRKTIGDFKVRYFQSMPFYHGVPVLAVKNKKIPQVKGYTEVIEGYKLFPSDKYLNSKKFKSNAQSVLEDEIQNLKIKNELKAETKELRAYIDKAFAKK